MRPVDGEETVAERCPPLSEAGGGTTKDHCGESGTKRVLCLGIDRGCWASDHATKGRERGTEDAGKGRTRSTFGFSWVPASATGSAKRLLDGRPSERRGIRIARRQAFGRVIRCTMRRLTEGASCAEARGTVGARALSSAGSSLCVFLFCSAAGATSALGRFIVAETRSSAPWRSFGTVRNAALVPSCGETTLALWAGRLRRSSTLRAPPTTGADSSG